MAESYEREKLSAAVNCLAASAAPIQKRIEYAWMAMHTLKNHGFTNQDRASDYEEIYERLTADKSDAQAGHVPTTCSRLSDDEAAEIAQMIVDLNSRLHMDRMYQLEDQLRANGK